MAKRITSRVNELLGRCKRKRNYDTQRKPIRYLRDRVSDNEGFDTHRMLHAITKPCKRARIEFDIDAVKA